ncbi:serine hydrolase [Mucilaginibacter sp. AK015]|uniref:serine hydrolase n=1 Tax=Mucilaginibacter sp. AK015 TaxID=2723072 RepID=UPI00161EDD8D|nr:serine hydrolase [Mucilaginibacter sp. AK015]MBB5396109.1 CubicO group peptidase (beta-lactamase class C family) [Mucilaginibacter sp. AK015]
MKLRYLFSIAVLSGTLSVNTVKAQMAPAKIDSLVQLALKTFDVPGIAVAVVKDGKLVYSHGYGVASLRTKQKVDGNTLFGIASNSKAFTAAAIGMLADEQKLKLDDKVTDYIPEFKMYDPYVTAEFTIRDLLTHRSGLGLGAGDLMIFPDSADFKVKDIIHNLRYLKPASSFRSKFDYDNQMYIVAGEIIARVSGMSWEDFIETRIMKPLQMTGSFASYSRIKNTKNYIDAHAPVDGKVVVIPRSTSEPTNAAGGIYSSVNDLSKWAIMQMNDGKYGEGLSKRLFSSRMHHEMWTVQTALPVSTPGPYNAHFSGYGLGWFLNDAKGYLKASHTGGLDGMVTQVTLFPEIKLGVIVLTNQQSGAAFISITNEIVDSYIGDTGKDWVKLYGDVEKLNAGGATAVVDAVWKQVEEQKKTNADGSMYTGTYHDNWLGDATISQTDGQLWFAAKRSPLLKGRMFHYNANTYVVKWNKRSMDADAFIMFTTDENGKPLGFKMKPISPATDFSYDFQDLDFVRAK